jgi:hypothetical protein
MMGEGEVPVQIMGRRGGSAWSVDEARYSEESSSLAVKWKREERFM